ncbi:MAG: phosphodiester glycosidase family protein [Victivallaceae bacterium]
MKRLMTYFTLLAATTAAFALSPAEVGQAMEKNFGKPETFEEKKAGDDLACQSYYYRDLNGKPRAISILIAKPSAKLKVKLVRPEKLTEVSQQLEASGAVAAINGTYFGIGKADKKLFDSGLLKIDGAIHPDSSSERAEQRPWGGYFWIRGADCGIDGMADFKAEDKTELLWGHPLLLKAGQVNPLIPKESSHMTAPHPRTAIGKSADGTLLMVVIDGRHADKATGMPCVELAEFMAKIGGVEALNLDGGGSSTLVWRNAETGNAEVISHPSDNKLFDHQGERKVLTTIQLFR